MAPEEFSIADVRIDDLPLYNQDDDASPVASVQRLKHKNRQIDDIPKVRGRLSEGRLPDQETMGLTDLASWTYWFSLSEDGLNARARLTGRTKPVPR